MGTVAKATPTGGSEPMPTKRSFIPALVLALALAAAAAACGGSSEGSEGAKQAAKQEITVNWGAEPPSLDPGLAADTTSSNILLNIIGSARQARRQPQADAEPRGELEGER